MSPNGGAAFPILTIGASLQDASPSADAVAAQLGGTLEAGLWLHGAGCVGVGGACGDLEARWTKLKERSRRREADDESRRELEAR